MAYADQQMSGNRITAFIIVALLHLVLGYALVTGLAYEGVKQIMKKVTTIDIKKDEPKKEPPPPPKKLTAPPPIVAPPPKINVSVAPPPVQTVVTPPPLPPPPIIAPPAPVPAPPPPRFQPKGAAPKGNPANWATTNDYPSRALREEREGTTGFRVTVGPDGRVTSCDVTSSSGSSDLDEATCSNVTRRARFTPAMDGEGNPTSGSYSNRIRWVIPKD
ncbi:energy transducer TonB [Novosphingobium sp. B 225]|uniref:energy transducer TonB n=1 Tax=Novosphingobium sp. B 225 TaxID=1961849 RepID=UPI000B4B09CB|nr:energy transducer TonB [Novosphingobium sp. B 225]